MPAHTTTAGPVGGRLGVLRWTAAAHALALARASCPSGWTNSSSFGGSCIKLTSLAYKQNECPAACLPGVHACISNGGENAAAHALASNVDDNPGYWLAINDKHEEGHWCHDCDRYAHWSSADPNNYEGNEQCGAVLMPANDFGVSGEYTNGHWVDLQCSVELLCLCEYAGPTNEHSCTYYGMRWYHYVLAFLLGFGWCAAFGVCCTPAPYGARDNPKLSTIVVFWLFSTGAIFHAVLAPAVHYHSDCYAFGFLGDLVGIGFAVFYCCAARRGTDRMREVSPQAAASIEVARIVPAAGSHGVPVASAVCMGEGGEGGVPVATSAVVVKANAAPLTLEDQARVLRRELGLGDSEGVEEVVREAAHQLGVSFDDRSAEELAAACMARMGLSTWSHADRVL